MAVKMAELGLPVTMDDVRAEAGEDADVIARPHFAQALIKKGVVRSVNEAFDRYLVERQAAVPAQRSADARTTPSPCCTRRAAWPSWPTPAWSP